MYEFYPYFTSDGSVGLYSKEADDIYHSAYGALTEAYEKFILPADFDKYFLSQNKIKILDICFGIGYNSKSFLNYFLNNICKKNKKNFLNQKNKFANNMNYNEAIYTDNNYRENLKQIKENKNIYSDTIHADKIFTRETELFNNLSKKNNIFITAIDTDKILMYLSPFFKQNGKNKKLPFNNEKVAKMLNVKVEKQFSLKKETNIILFELLKNNCSDFLENETLNSILSDKKYKHIFDNFMVNLYYQTKNFRYKKIGLSHSLAFLHNIYYRYISRRYKKAREAFKFNDIIFNRKCDDARKILISDNEVYNYIFLDAFSPEKCPCLWTLEFFKELYKHLDENGMILTYSNSANIRNTFLQAGFYIGKNYNSNAKKYSGTIATKNKSLIKYELSEFDLGLMKTKAGIIYRDENLNALNEDIIKRHKFEFENSDLISSTKFINQYRAVHNGEKSSNNYGEVI